MKLSSFEEIFSILDACHGEFPSKCITFVNPTNFFEIQELELDQKFDVIFSDGFLLCFMENLLTQGKRLKRASFDYSSIAGIVFNHAVNKKLTVGIIGAREAELGQAITNIRKNHQNINIKFFHDGFYCESEEPEIIGKLSGLDLIIIGMGFPRQDYLALKIKDFNQNNTLIFTCGGFLTQTARSVSYYSDYVNKFELRWFVRAIRHSHVRKKLRNQYPKFMFKYTALLLKKWRKISE